MKHTDHKQRAHTVALACVKGFASRPSKPERLNTRIEVGSTFPVIAMMGMMTPDARSAAQTCARK